MAGYRFGSSDIPAEAEDEQLFARYVAGDETAFDVLFQRYEPSLTKFIRSRLKADDRSVADLVQETFLRVHRARHSFDPKAKLSSWVFTIAANLVKNEYRRLDRRRETPFSDLTANGRPGRSDWPQFGDPNQNPEQEFRRGQLADAITSAFESLSPHHQVALELRETGHSFKEVAEVLDIPVNTAKSRVIRARRAFEHHFGKVHKLAS